MFGKKKQEIKIIEIPEKIIPMKVPVNDRIDGLFLGLYVGISIVNIIYFIKLKRAGIL